MEQKVLPQKIIHCKKILVNIQEIKIFYHEQFSHKNIQQ